MSFEDSDIKEAIVRIGLTPDGELLHLWLQKHLHLVVRTTDPGALQQENGRRILAADLMSLLSAGINEAHTSVRSDRIIVLRQSGPVATGGDNWIARRRAKLFGADEHIGGPGVDGRPGPDDSA
jgi:hypothetical protein